MLKLPELKKKIASFLTKEDGKITKEGILKTGLVLAAVALTSLKTANAGSVHSSSLSMNFDANSKSAVGTHGSHTSHTSHSSHGSHGSHGSHHSTY